MANKQEIADGLSEMLNGKDNKFQTEFHTLFVEEVPAIFVPVQIEGEDELNKNPITMQASPAHKVYSLYLSDFAHIEAELHDILHELRNADEDNDELHIDISSNGGLVTETITIYGLIREVFRGRSVTYVSSYAYSAGAFTFSFGDKRVIYDYASVMFHDYIGGNYGAGDNIMEQEKHQSKNLHRFFEDRMVKTCFITKEEYSLMRIGKEYWFDALEMAERGIATNVIVDGEELTSEEYIRYRSLNMSIEEFVKSKDLPPVKLNNESKKKTGTKPLAKKNGALK